MKRDDRLVRLSWDHHHALVFARRIAVELPDASDDDAGALYSDLLSFYAAGLLPHFRLEGECLLGRLVRAVAPEHEAVRRTLDDHLYLEALVMTMRDTAEPTERREALRRFGQTLRDHVRWEESVLFDLVQSALPDDDLDALGEDIATLLPPLEPAP